MSNPTVGALLLASMIASLVGCGPRNPVTEVTVADSGVTISSQENLAPPPADWPAWRGPRFDGIAPPQRLATDWTETENIRWRTAVPGRGHSSPIVVGDSVYLATADDAEFTQSVIAIDRATGRPRWTKVVHRGGFPTDKELHVKATNANGTIASDGRRLYISFLNSNTITATALDFDGELLWQTELGKYVCRFGYAPSPILYKSCVIFAADNRGGGYLSALDGQTGEVAWRIKRGNLDNYSSPTVARVGGRDQLLISGCDTVASYDPGSGEPNWMTRCVAESTCGTIVTSDDRIFASGGYPQRETVCLSADGNVLWKNSVKIYEPSMLVAGERLIGITDEGIAYCWDTTSGSQLWRKRLGGNFSASPLLCGDKVYVGNLKGETFVFRASDRYELIARNKIGDDCYASPAASKGDLFLRIGIGQGNERQEELVCITNLKSGESLPSR